MSMGRFFDFAKRRIVGYIVSWILVLLFLGVFYQGNPPAQAGGLFILGVAFIGSLLYTRRMKRRQRARRGTEGKGEKNQKGEQEEPKGPLQAPPTGEGPQSPAPATAPPAG